MTVVAAKKALACAEAALDEQIAALNAEIASVLNERAKTDVRIEAIRPLEGVGPGLLAVLHAYLPELGKVGRKQISSLAGVVPQARDSGKLQGRRYVYGGKRVVRTALYAACICFLRKNSPYRARYDALRARNKSHRTVLIAMAHDLIIRINAVIPKAIQSGWPFGAFSASLENPVLRHFEWVLRLLIKRARSLPRYFSVNSIFSDKGQVSVWSAGSLRGA